MRTILILLFVSSTLFGQYQTSNLDFLFNGSIAVNGSDTLLVDSITGTFDVDYVLTDVDFDITLGYLPGKTRAKLNGQPINTYFQNANFADTLFTQWLDQELNSDLTENKPFRIQRIAHYSTPTTDDNDYFQTPSQGTLTVGVGKTYSTTQAAINASSGTDTIDIYDGVYTEGTNLFPDETGLTIRGVGNAEVRSTGTRVISMGVNDLTIEGITINAEDNKLTAVENNNTDNNTLRRCYITGYTAQALRRTDGLLCDKTVFYEESETNYVIDKGTAGNLTLSECYSNSSNTLSAFYRLTDAVDTFKFSYCDLNLNANSSNDAVLLVHGGAAIFEYTNINIDHSDVRVISTIASKTNDEDLEFTGCDIVIDSLQPNYFISESNSVDVLYKITNTSFTTNAGEGGFILVSAQNKGLIARNNTIDINIGDAFSFDLADSIYIVENNDISIRKTDVAANGFTVSCRNTTTDVDVQINENIIKLPGSFGQDSSVHAGIFLIDVPQAEIKYNYVDGADSLVANIVTKSNTSRTGAVNVIQGNISVNGGILVKNIQDVYVYNNTVNNSKSYAYSIVCDATADSFYFKNNIASNSLIGLDVARTGTTGLPYLDNNNNIYYNNANQFHFNDGVTDENYTLSEWQAFSSTESNSFNTDPNFQSSTQLWPVKPSNAIGKGRNLGSTYRQGLNISSSWPDNVVLRNQLSRWSIGAYVVNLPNTVLLDRNGNPLLTRDGELLISDK